MKKLSLISVIIVAAAVLTVTLSGCNKVIYPSIENIDEVFTKMEEIESFDCDMYITTQGTMDTVVINQLESICFKMINIKDAAPVISAYPIKNSAQKIYTVGTKIFAYQNDKLLTEEELAASEDDILIPTDPLMPISDSYAYTASYDVPNRTTFTADFTAESNELIEALGLEGVMANITKSSIAIEADNNTKMPVSVSYALGGDIEVTIPADEVNKTPEKTITVNINMVIKMVFKKYNDAVKIDYPQEVSAYIAGTQSEQ